MGSVQELHECPNCKSEDCMTDFYYKSGEEFTNCPDCGYFRANSIKRNEEGEYIKDKDGKVIFERNELKNPFAAYCIRPKGSQAYQCGSLESEESFKNFEKIMKSSNEVEFACISRFVDGKIQKTALVGDLKQRNAN